MKNILIVEPIPILLQVSLASQTEHLGSIGARVVDQAGNPVTGAVVWMLPLDGTPRANALADCLTDAAGSCKRDGLALGRYQVTAKKESDGYPNIAFDLYGRNNKPQIAVLAPEAQHADTTITLGPKAASISVTVTDAVSGKPVTNPNITLRRAANPADYISTGPDSNSNVLIPPEEDILVEVSADGYKPWRIESQSGADYARALHLRSAETRELKIRLQPQ